MKRTIVAIVVCAGLLGCGWLAENVPKTLPDIARLVCLLAAKDRPAEARVKVDDECWCADHAKEYAEELLTAKQAASRRAGLAVPATEE
jgi:hypothetical protein